MKKVMTLGLIVENGKILLGMKKRGFGEGRWNGYGGKLKDGETLEFSLAREFLEEAGIRVLRSEKKGVINFFFDGQDDYLEVHFFKVHKFDGEPIETEEMKPRWFDVDELPFQSMWPDDPHWMPLFLQGKSFRGDIHFKDQNTIIDCKLDEVPGFA